MPNYSKGKIYTLRSHQTDDIYIGSTINTLPKRLGQHKTKFNLWKNGKYPYLTSFELIKYDDCYIELFEDFPCENRNQLEQREGHHIRSMDCVNKIVVGRTKKEYRIENADKIKEYRIENADKIKEYYKEYRIENADKLKEHNKQYYIENADKLKEKNNCECGGKYTKQHLLRHQKSKRHQEYLATN